jgi:hypothetical protein
MHVAISREEKKKYRRDEDEETSMLRHQKDFIDRPNKYPELRHLGFIHDVTYSFRRYGASFSLYDSRSLACVIRSAQFFA